ncbi:MAG: efflux RND transporter periplasmic adaptor subunit [Bacteroidota bacterium]|nr:efflux RND transporter periplasmic adaptor subunit [Bacteroidota bacterium]MDP4213768.1 efflux RND transporter periplasmic adaptor subunit [Bacteroidota bacterium]MDP4251498.1 efflux RND transporter periplasmic adaptor subunit [Bacteroidota bacterium]
MRRLNKILVFAFTVFSAGLYSCGSKIPDSDEKQGYVLPDSLLKTLEIDTVSASKVLNTLTLTGKVDFNEDQVIKIYPAISGLVSDIKVMLGDYVKKGQTLAVLKSVEMAGFSNDYTMAKSNLGIARKSLDATNDMYKSGLASQRDQLAAQEAYNQALSGLQKSQRILNLNGGSLNGDYTVKSPIDGFVVEKQVNNNMVIRTDNSTGLFTISDLKNVWVMANVYESNIANIKSGDSVEVTTLSYPGKIFRGKVDKIMNVLDPTNKVMKLRIVLPNPGYLLKPEMFASVLVRNMENKKMISIPSRALIFDHSQYYVLVYKSPKDITIRPVQVMNTVGDRSFISEGLSDGEKLIGTQALLIYQELNS